MVAAASGCSQIDQWTTGCGEVSGGGVDVGVGNNVVGGGGGESGGGVGGSGSAEGGVEAPCIATSVELCNEQRLEASAPGPAVTTREIAHLVPGVSVQGMEPRGFMVVGLPTNFYADAQPSIVSTTLLGTPAEVRFTPVSFTWDNGDGSTTTSRSGGATWAALGLDEFSETETSHIFDRAGDYTISLTILYSAEYRIGGGAWRPLAGTVPSTSPPLTASAKAAKTVLVADDCGRRRISPGC